MWHEARRQERKIRGMLVDYRRRAERRRDFYEKIKADPTQFLQLHGRPCKIHLDSAVAAAADSPATMMPWQGQSDNLIDRFDVRAHLDFIPPVTHKSEEEISYEERQCNYERYRILAQNSFLGMSEDKFLKQLHLEEQFGYTSEMDKDKKRRGTGAAIGLNYDDPTATKDTTILKQQDNSENEDNDESDSDLDVDLCIDVSKVEQTQAHELNKCGQQFGMCSNDFYSFLTNDMEEAENIRLAREEEHEKALFSGRKSRRERRAHREKRLANRVLSPPSYAARDSPTYPAFRESKSKSRTPSPVNAGQITYITSFGDDEEPAPSTSKPTYADKVKFGRRKSSDTEKSVRYDKLKREDKRYSKRRSRSKSRSRSISRSKTRSTSRSRSRYYSRRKRSPTRSRSRSPHRRRSGRYRSYTRSRSRSRRSRNRRSRSRSRSKSSSTSSRSRNSSSSSSSASSHKSRSRSKSSNSVSSKSSVKDEPPKVPVQRYYGRRGNDKSSSEFGDSSGEDSKAQGFNPAPADKVSVIGNSGTAVKPVISNLITKMTPQERLKRKMQLLLNRQYKADKIAEQIRTERAQQEQRNREDELREMALKLRRKQRERRHAYDSNHSSDSDSSSSRDRPRSNSSRRSRSPASPRRRSSRDRDERRDKDKSPPYTSRSEYKRKERSCTPSPPGTRDETLTRKSKHCSLVDY